MADDKRLSLNLGLEAARREAEERERAQPVPVAEVAFEAPEAPKETAPAVIPQAASAVTRTVGFDGTVIETNVALDAPPGAWRYQPKPQTRRASSLPRR